jgi:ABC-type transport system involved in cytochrome c biogenesis permease subunit
MPPRVTLPPTPADARRIRRSRIVSFVLVAVAAVVFSLRPEAFGDPQSQPLHALLHVWRVVVGLALAAAALAVQVAVGIRWRKDLRRSAEDPTADTRVDPLSTGAEPPGNRAPRDR